MAITRQSFNKGNGNSNVNVLSDILKILGTPWLVATKVGLREIYKGLNFSKVFIIIPMLILFPLVGFRLFIYYSDLQG
ncbi:MAG TPA: hypothetical protein VMV36_02180 [Ignavibacteriaceae bacterium]|nr:hypothetical protein [Ignavibacteriaceae bacterium]